MKFTVGYQLRDPAESPFAELVREPRRIPCSIA